MNLTRAQIETQERSGDSQPPFFTGKWKGSYYYKGLRVPETHRNRIGQGSPPRFATKRNRRETSFGPVYVVEDVCVRSSEIVTE